MNKEVIKGMLENAVAPYEAFESDELKKERYKEALSNISDEFIENGVLDQRSLVEEMVDDLRDDIKSCGGSIFARMSEVITVLSVLSKDYYNELISEVAEVFELEYECFE